MGKFSKAGGREMPELNTSSLPDLVFAFLFFIMMVTTMREVTLKVEFRAPQATELQKLEKKSLVTFIYVGKPTQDLQAKMGSETRIQLNDAFAETSEIQDYIAQEKSSMKEEDQPFMTVSIKADRETKMGVITDIKQALGIVSATMQDQVRVHLPVVDIVCGGLFGTLGLPRHVEADEDARARALDALDRLGIAELADRDVMTLSTGQVRRVLVARELMSDPRILIFDEPCTGLDPQGMYHVRDTMRMLADEGRSVVLVTHYPEDIIPAIGRVLLIKDAEVFADGPKEELLDSATMSELFGVPLTVDEREGWYSLRGRY